MELEPDKPRAGAPEWLVTFGDMMSLLLTFFILLVSYSNMEIKKFRAMAGSVRNAFGAESKLDVLGVATGSKLLPFVDPRQSDDGAGRRPLQAAQESVEQILKQSGLEAAGTVRIDERGVLLQLQGDLLFDSGSAGLNPKSLPLLDRLAAYSSTVEHSIEVDGHTDNIPIATMIYPSNWELSAARAGSAVRYLAEKGVPPARMRATGHADTVPVAPNSASEGRAKNRRIEILFVINSETDGKAGNLAAEIQPAPEPAINRGGNE